MKAIEDYSKALAIDDTLVDAYNNRGVIYTILRQYDLAIEDWEHALVLDPNFTSVRLNLQVLKRKQEMNRQEVLASENE